MKIKVIIRKNGIKEKEKQKNEATGFELRERQLTEPRLSSNLNIVLYSLELRSNEF